MVAVRIGRNVDHTTARRCVFARACTCRENDQELRYFAAVEEVVDGKF